ncbi:MAG: nitroreductase [Pseudomonadota bacterium]
MTVEEAVTGRRSVRAFLDRPVPEATVRAILEAAGRTPSGANMQPWQVHVVTGTMRERVGDAAIAEVRRGEGSPDYAYYPDDWFEPYIGRRRKIGFDLYALLGIGRGDTAGREAQSLANFRWFGAPVGLFVLVDRRLNPGSWVDCGMFIQSILLLARSHGLETCAQASWVRHGGIVRQTLGIGDDLALVAGIALGYEDRGALANRLVTERAPVDAFCTFHDH